jgi:peptide/nickel transport system substrate-binding protein
MLESNIDNPELPPTPSEEDINPNTDIPQTSAPVSSLNNNPPNKTNKRLLSLVLVVFILLIALAAYVYSTRTNNKQTATTKKDIPYLTYGFSDSGDVTPSYPLENADTVNSIYIDNQVFEGLVAYKDQTKVTPSLAIGWNNPDNNTWIFNLRHGVKFHSGRIMTAKDVKYSLDYAVAYQNNYTSSTDLYLASTIKHVDIVNTYQVKITTNGPDAVLLNRLTGLYILDSKAKLGDPNAGTGPYTVKPGTVKPNATSVDLLAFNGYWGGHVYTREVRMQEESTIDKLAAATANGKYDISGDYDAEQLATIKAKVKYFQPIVVPDLGVNYLGLNTERTTSPLHSLAARQAMTYALNIPAILKAGSLSGTPASQIIPSTLPGYDPSIKTTQYDPAKAKQLLAGVPNASKSLTLNFPVGDEGQLGEIAKELDAVGFSIKLIGINDLSTLVNMTIAGQGDMFYLGYDTNTLDGLDMINNVVLGTQNYSSTAITDLANQASLTIDPATRIAILQKIEHLVNADLPTIALFTETRNYVLTKPYTVKVDLPSIDAGTNFWQIYQK